MNLTPPAPPAEPEAPVDSIPSEAPVAPAEPPAPTDDFVVHDDEASASEAAPLEAQHSSGLDVEHAVEALEQGEVVEDDDVMNVPAPEPATLAYSPRVPKKGPRPPIYATLGFKQTVIPILLTLGVCLPLVGLLSFVWRDSALGILGDEAPSIPITFLVVGVILLGFAVLNMIQVKRQLAEK